MITYDAILDIYKRRRRAIIHGGAFEGAYFREPWSAFTLDAFASLCATPAATSSGALSSRTTSSTAASAEESLLVLRVGLATVSLNEVTFYFKSCGCPSDLCNGCSQVRQHILWWCDILQHHYPGCMAESLLHPRRIGREQFHLQLSAKAYEELLTNHVTANVGRYIKISFAKEAA